MQFEQISYSQFKRRKREQNFLIAAILTAVVCALVFVALVYGSDEFTSKNMDQADQAKLSALATQINFLGQEHELAQTKLDLTEAKLQLLNEVIIPKIVAELRSKYNKPEGEWDVNLQNFSFTKKPK